MPTRHILSAFHPRDNENAATSASCSDEHAFEWSSEESASLKAGVGNGLVAEHGVMYGHQSIC